MGMSFVASLLDAEDLVVLEHALIAQLLRADGNPDSFAAATRERAQKLLYAVQDEMKERMRLNAEKDR